MRWRVSFHATASASVEVETPDGLEPEEARDRALDMAYDLLPGNVCAQCANSWGDRGRAGMEISGEWEADDDEPDAANPLGLR